MCVDDIDPNSNEWLDKPFLQSSAFHLVAGPKGVGKGTWLIKVAAKMSRGLYGDRVNEFDARLAKIIRIGRTRTNIGFDLYNLLNSSAVLSYNQAFSTVTVSIPGFQPVSVQGIGESRYGADAGAAASLSVTNNLRFYARYDGKFREQFVSHQGTAGLEVRW